MMVWVYRILVWDFESLVRLCWSRELDLTKTYLGIHGQDQGMIDLHNQDPALPAKEDI